MKLPLAARDRKTEEVEAELRELMAFLSDVQTELVRNPSSVELRCKVAELHTAIEGRRLLLAVLLNIEGAA